MASELNNAAFTVERSLDARAFAAVGTLPGAGTSTTRHAYDFLDTRLPASFKHLSFSRLRGGV